MIKKILITGSSGQVGSHLVEHFIDKYEVVGLDIKKSGIKVVDDVTKLYDIRDLKPMKKSLKNVDLIIHAAAQLDAKRSIEGPIFDANINIIGTLNLLELARKSNKLSKFINISSSSVYGNSKYLPIDEKHPLVPISPYGLSKLVAEKYCILFNKLFNLPVVSLRPFNIYSSREDSSEGFISIIYRFVERVKNNEPLIIHGDGKQLRNFIHVKDIISFIDLIIDKKGIAGEVYNLGSGKPTNILDIARLVLKINGKDENENIIFQKLDEEEIEDSYADIKKANKLGWKPEISMEDGIKEIIELYKKQRV